MKPKPERIVKLNSWLLPALIGVIMVVHLITPYKGWQVLLIGLGGTLFLSFLWAKLLARGLALDRQLQVEWAQVGDQITERFRIFNYSWIPALWIEVMDHSTIPDYGTYHVKSIRFKDWIQWEKSAFCSHRGEFSLGPTTIITSDPFGLFSITLKYPSSLDLIVLPPTLPLPEMDIAPGGRAGEGFVRTKTIEHSVSAASVREYNPGDSLRWVHWPTSARRDSLHVRLFDASLSSDWWIVLDMDRAVHRGEDLDATEEYTVVLAASLANQGLRLGQAVGLVAHDENLIWHPPYPGEGQRWDIMHTLASISLGSRPFSDLLQGIGQSLGHHTSLVLITPSPHLGWTKELLQLTRQGVIPTIIFLDPASFDLGIDLKPIRKTLIDLGIRHYVIDRGMLNFFDPRTQLLEALDEPPTRKTRLSSIYWLSDVKWEIFK
jgi:uncharacterized protein (DUF58 family)